MKSEILDIKVISRDAQFYCAWGTVARTRAGKLFVVCSGGRRKHLDPFGQVQIIESEDDGDTWSWHWVLADGPIDDRDAGIIETQAGTLLVNWFTSLGWTDRIAKVNEQELKDEARDEHAEWKRRAARVTPEIIEHELGAWMIRSTDGGLTWSERVAPHAGSPHGPLQLDNRRLLFVGNGIPASDSERTRKNHPYASHLGASVSDDDGQSWQWISQIPFAEGHGPGWDYHEPHAVQATDGRIVVHIRNHGEPHRHEILQTESHDGGQTWTTPHSLGRYGFPAHLLRLRDGRLVSTYGHRADPVGVRAVLSADHGETWSERIVLTDDAPSKDMGYPSTIELEDGRLLTAWYEAREGRKYTGMCQARWRLAD